MLVMTSLGSGKREKLFVKVYRRTTVMFSGQTSLLSLCPRIGRRKRASLKSCNARNCQEIFHAGLNSSHDTSFGGDGACFLHVVSMRIS